eukprot:2782429-Pleurochrysis_carterae.AAC.5
MYDKRTEDSFLRARCLDTVSSRAVASNATSQYPTTSETPKRGATAPPARPHLPASSCSCLPATMDNP